MSQSDPDQPVRPPDRSPEIVTMSDPQTANGKLRNQRPRRRVVPGRARPGRSASATVSDHLQRSRAEIRQLQKRVKFPGGGPTGSTRRLARARPVGRFDTSNAPPRRLRASASEGITNGLAMVTSKLMLTLATSTASRRSPPRKRSTRTSMSLWFTRRRGPPEGTVGQEMSKGSSSTKGAPAVQVARIDQALGDLSGKTSDDSKENNAQIRIYLRRLQARVRGVRAIKADPQTVCPD